MKQLQSLIILALLACIIGCAHTDLARLDANKALVTQLGAINDRADWDALDDILTEDFKRHSVATTLNPVISSPEEFKRHEQFLHELYPDRHVTYEKVIAEGDYVAARATFTGTNQEVGKPIKVPYLVMMRMDNCRIAEIWVEWDNLAAQPQLGLLPPP